MNAISILITTAIIFSCITTLIALILFFIAIRSKKLKIAERKRYLQNSVFVFMNGIAYWAMIGIGCGIVYLVTILEKFI